MLKVKDQELEQEYIPVSPLGYNGMKTCLIPYLQLPILINDVKSTVRHQYFGDTDTFRGLIILEDGCENTGQC